MTSSTKTLGTIGELAVTQTILREGFEVFREVTDSSRIDLVVLAHNQFFKVQVKTTRSKNGAVSIEKNKITNRKRFSYTEKDIDVIATFVEDKNIVLFVPMSEMRERKNGMTLRFEPPRSGQKKWKSFENFVTFALQALR